MRLVWQKTLTILLAAGLTVGLSLAKEHTFTSTKGGETIKATIEDYSPKDQTALLNSGGKRLNVSVSAFSKEDKKKFEEWYSTEALRRKIWVTITKMETPKSQSQTLVSTIRKSNVGFNVEVRNGAASDFKNFSFKYRIFYKQDFKNDKFLTKDGSFKIDKIGGQKTINQSTSVVEITTQKVKAKLPLVKVENKNKGNNRNNRNNNNNNRNNFRVAKREPPRFDQVEGIIIKMVNSDKKVVKTFTFPSSLKKEW